MKNLKYCVFVLLNLSTPDTIAFGQSTVITGNFENTSTSSKTVSIDVFNLLDEHPTNYLAFVDAKTGNFRIDFPQYLTQEIILKSGESLNLILSPGDSLNIQFNKNGNIIFSGSNSKTNQEILYFSKNKDWGSFKPECEGKSINQYKDELAKWVQNEKSKLYQFKIKYHPSKLFIKWASQDIIYRNANYLVDFAVYRQMNGQALEKGLIDTAIFPIDNDSALISLFYRAHLNQYLVFKYKIYDDISKNPNEFQNFVALQGKFNYLLLNEKYSKSKDILIIDFFNILLKIDRQNAFNFIKLNIDKIKNNELHNLFTERVNSLKTNAKPITFLSNQDSSSKIIENVFADLTERFKGKVIYLDFWATWCGPCRSEFPFSHSLAKEFENENVAFVYICMDSEFEKWKKSTTDLKLNQNQYFLNEVESKVLRQKFQIHGLPTYFIVNKKGEIVDKDAPRPSNPITKSKIIELVNEN